MRRQSPAELKFCHERSTAAKVLHCNLMHNESRKYLQTTGKVHVGVLQNLIARCTQMGHVMRAVDADTVPSGVGDAYGRIAGLLGRPAICTTPYTWLPDVSRGSGQVHLLLEAPSN